jgi:hypothetical protein
MRIVLAFLTLLACLEPAVAQIVSERDSLAQRIGGRWVGRYFYAGPHANRPPVEFEFTLEVPAAGKVTGRSSEPNTVNLFGAPFLYANMRGEIIGNLLRCVATYDGTGGVNHSSNLVGTFNENWTTLVGTWRVNEEFGGRFEMRR